MKMLKVLFTCWRLSLKLVNGLVKFHLQFYHLVYIYNNTSIIVMKCFPVLVSHGVS